MSIAYGVTEQGFVAKPLSVVKSELDARFKANVVGQSAGTEPDGSIPGASLAGQIIAAMTDGLAAQWDLQQAVATAQDPNAATGAAQDAICAVSGTVRDGAAASTVLATCTGTPNTDLLAARAATVEDTGARFLSRDDATIVAVDAWIALTGYLVGDRVTNAGNVYQCAIAGTSAGSGGPTGTGSGIVDGGVTWDYLGQGTGAVDTLFEAEVAGAIGALAGTLNTIATPVDGWKTVTNVLDAELGALQEGNTALRLRREAELHADGLAAVDAIRTAVSRVGHGSAVEADRVTACTVFYNDDDVANADGLPGHSVEVLVLGGQDQAVGQAIWDAVGGGIATHREAGSSGRTVIAVDSQGNAQTVYFSRPTAVPVYVVADVLYDQTPGAFPSDGGDELAGAIKTFGDTYVIGRDVRSSAIGAAIFDGPISTEPDAAPVPGVLDATAKIGTAPAPGGTTPITITSRQIATFDSSRITVNLTPGSP